MIVQASRPRIAVKRALVLDLAASEFVKITDLAEDRAHRRYLEKQPFERLVARRGIGGHELSRLLRKVEKNRTGFEERQRFASRAGGIDDGRNFAVRVERKVLWRALVVLAEVDKMDLIRQTGLFQHDRDLDAVRRREGIELQSVRMFGRPSLCDGKGGEIGHALSSDIGAGL